ncbi:MAG: hypothetical protein ABL884_06465 [Methyloglobulus sp.]
MKIQHYFAYTCGVFLLCTGLGNTAIGETTRVSVSSNGTQGGDESSDPSISADGRFVAFQSFSDNLVNDTNFNQDIFLHDRLTKQTSRVSVSSTGIEGNGFSTNPTISADGRYIAFESLSTNLVSGDTNGTRDIFVHDRLTKKTTRVSISSSGSQGENQSYSPSISADGRFIAFESLAKNLTIGNSNPYADVFIHDRVTKQTSRITTLTYSGPIGDGPSISADGRFVAFETSADSLIQFTGHVYIHDRASHQTARVNVSSNATGGLNATSKSPSISADGRYVAFSSGAKDLVVGDNNNFEDIFVHDRITKQTTRVSVSSNGAQGNSPSQNPSISANGRYVAFHSNASNLVNGDTNGGRDIFVHDRATGQTSRASISPSGAQPIPFQDTGPTISAEGRYVAFDSRANDLIPVDPDGYFGDTNTVGDIFVRDRTLNTAQNADLKVSTTLKPASLAKSSNGTYLFTVTNKGPNTLNSTSLIYQISGGGIVSIVPSQGGCGRYTSITLCNLGAFLPGASKTLQVVVKANLNPLIQQVYVSATPSDSLPGNNQVSVSTLVTQ